MKKHTIALTCIMKNERHNLPRLLESVKRCFDEIHFTDTGSTDGSIEYITSGEAFRASGVPVYLHHFDWVNDFALARNHALPYIMSDYWMWMDLDDAMGNAEKFQEFVKYVMPMNDVWFVPYLYAFNDQGKPVCSFLRERVFRTSLNMRFTDFVHEGVIAKDKSANMIHTWTVNHVRTEAELAGDKGRNLKILEERRNELSSRLLFYLGKEYFDNQRFEEARNTLLEVCLKPDLEHHDKVTAMQYLANASFLLKKFDETIQYCLYGMKINPHRAEYYCMIGDAYMAMGQHYNAIPFYHAAMNCVNSGANGMSPSYTLDDCYGPYPKTQLGALLFQQGRFQDCLKMLEGVTLPQAIKISLDAKKAIDVINYKSAEVEKVKCDDIVFTCLPNTPYPWDTKIYKEKGIGGSETAACEIATHLRKLTGKKVKVFNDRKDVYVDEHGVEFLPMSEVQLYFKQFRPKIHIAWRHSVRLTDEPSYIWCHDLITPGAENLKNYDKIIVLSEFHKNYVKAIQGIPDEKIIVSKNGIEPSRFVKAYEKKKGKVIWPNSPDRGLDHALRVMDLVIKEIPEAELHVFYGMDNMKKCGQAEKAMMLEAMIAERPYVKYHGNVTQSVLADHMFESQVWLYNTIFLETYCITAIEALSCRTWPVVRNIGALSDTLKSAAESFQCDLLDLEPDQYEVWAGKVIDAIRLEKCSNMNINPSIFAWENVAKEWMDMFELK